MIMKTYSYLIILSIVIVSCNDEPAGPDNRNALWGNWKWVQSDGGYAYHIIKPPAGVTEIHTYTPAGSFYISRNDTVEFATRYILEPADTNGPDRTRGAIVFENIWAITERMTITYFSNDTLYLWDNCMDCFGHLFVRVNKRPFRSPII
jgi:hypothetical protein